MSAKITVIVYILICFEVGILLLILPWTPTYWEDNFFLYFITSKLNAAWIPTLLTSGYVKGIVTGIGVLNILAGLRDILKFRESVNALTALGNAENDNETPIGFTSTESVSTEPGSTISGSTESNSTIPGSTKSGSTKSGPTQTVALSDHQPPGIPPQP